MRYEFAIVPYVAMFIVIVIWYRVLVSGLRLREKMFFDEHRTLLNTRIMARAHIHDISNYLTGITGALSIVKSPAFSEDKRIEYIGKAEQTAAALVEHLGTIVNILRNEQQLVTLQSMPLRQFLEKLENHLNSCSFCQVVDSRKPSPGKSEIEVYLVCGEEHKKRSIAVDPPLLCNAFLNLISNARKAEATRVTIAVDMVEKGFRFLITDNGKGLAPHLVETLFKKAISSSNGSGVGLLGVRNIVLCHGADIFIKEPNSDGRAQTVFCISGVSRG